MPIDPVAAYLHPEETKQSSLVRRLRVVGRQVIEDSGVQAGVAQVVAALAALAVRAVSPQCVALTRREPDQD
jgi:hypothetical protein